MSALGGDMNIAGTPGYGGGWGGGWGGGFGAIGLVGLLGLDSFGGRRRDGDDNGCANARFLALENGISQTQDMIQTQNVVGVIQHSADVASARFDAVQNNVNGLQTQMLLGGERTNGNIAEVKFQNALNFQALGKQVSDCCCDIEKSVMSDGAETRALITTNTIQALRDKNEALRLELSQCKQNELWMTLSNKIDRQNDALINFGTILNTKTNTGGIQG